MLCRRSRVRTLTTFVYCRTSGGSASVELQLVVFFFFQAEDAIRDLTVTGVQTCAHPIWPSQTVGFLAGPLTPFQGVFSVWPASPRLRRNLLLSVGAMPGPAWQILKPLPSTPGRSEERRVGKECRSRGLPFH